MTLAVQIDAQVGEVVMRFPAIGVPHLGEETGIVLRNGREDFCCSLRAAPAGEVASNKNDIGLLQ
jgi:hypothetical protein